MNNEKIREIIGKEQNDDILLGSLIRFYTDNGLFVRICDNKVKVTYPIPLQTCPSVLLLEGKGIVKTLAEGVDTILEKKKEAFDREKKICMDIIGDK